MSAAAASTPAEIVANLRHEARFVDVATAMNDEVTVEYARMCTGAADCIEALTAERDALKAAAEWMPIASAPTDGTYILVPVGHGLCNVVSWFDGAWREMTNALRLRNTPRFWLPLPKPPVTP